MRQGLAWSGWLALLLVLAQGARLARARAVARAAPAPFRCAPPGARRRVLVLGDSTGAGLGCGRPEESVAGRLAGEFADVEVVNLCAPGARVADVLQAARQLPAGPRFDLALVFAGGNDVLRWTGGPALRRDALMLVRLLRQRARRVLWAGVANVGLAPLFLPPFSWLLSARTRAATRLLAGCAARAGAEFVDFFHERGADPFSAEPARYYAGDRVHPSAAAHGWCYARMRPAIARALAPAD